jgi:hypothetical protein
MRSFATVLGFAAATAAATLAVCWPGRTYADPPERFIGAGDIDDVSFSGEVTRDATLKSGWAIKVTFENRGDEQETCKLDSELTRAQVNPAARAEPPGVTIWHHKDSVTVPAHESVARVYEIPASLARLLTANEQAMALREKLIEKESAKPTPNFALQMRPFTAFAVAFQKVKG